MTKSNTVESSDDTKISKKSTGRPGDILSQTSGERDCIDLDCSVERMPGDSSEQAVVTTKKADNNLNIAVTSNVPSEKFGDIAFEGSEISEKTEFFAKSKFKKLSFWIGIVAFVVVALQFVLELIGVEFETKIIIEISSYVLAGLVSAGLLTGSDKNQTDQELKETILKQIEDEVETQTTAKDKLKTRK